MKKIILALSAASIFLMLPLRAMSAGGATNGSAAPETGVATLPNSASNTPLATDAKPATPASELIASLLERSAKMLSFHKNLDKTCEVVMTAMRSPVHYTAEEQIKLFQEKEALELQIDKLLTKNSNVSRLARTEAVQIEEHLLFHLSTGDSDGALTYVRARVKEVNTLYKSVMDLGQKLAQFETGGQGYPEYSNLKAQYEDISAQFGIAYGKYKTIMRTLVSVAGNRGLLSGVNPVPLPDGTTDYKVVYDLRDPRSVATAMMVLRILDPEINERYFAENTDVHPWADIPSLRSAEYMFNHNIFALLGKLRNDVQEQEQVAAWYKTGMYLWANAILRYTDFKLMPDGLRRFLIRVFGLGYDSMMVEKYLERVQSLVNIGRRVDANGNVVMLSNDATMSLLIVALQKYDDDADANDFLITFARISYQTELWTQIKAAVAQRAAALKDKDKGESNKYSKLFDRLDKAENTAEGMPTLPYLDDPETLHRLRLAIVQMTWGAGFTWAATHLPQVERFFAPAMVVFRPFTAFYNHFIGPYIGGP